MFRIFIEQIAARLMFRNACGTNDNFPPSLHNNNYKYETTL